ncbi:MAG: hypothetical protein JO159_00565 [Acidobacteria bacterium]|nr:hypothetical protein [Acidobacteriota bacterium]
MKRNSPSTGYHILDWMIENDIPLTRENYIRLDWLGKVPKRVRDSEDWEYELSLPEQFRVPFEDADFVVKEPTPEEVRTRDRNLAQLGCRLTYCGRRGPVNPLSVR